MTPEQYFVEVKKLGLTPSRVRGVFIDSDGLTRNVPHPEGKTPEQRVEIIAKLKFAMGVGPDPLV